MKQVAREVRGKTKPEVELATRVSARVEIVDVFVVETVARRGPARGALPENLELNVNVDIAMDEEKLLIQVFPRFTLVARYDDEDSNEFLRIEARFALVYKVPSLTGLKKENIEAFGQVNGLYNAWPYWREYVHSMTARMGLPSLKMPVYRVPTAPLKTTQRKARTKTARKKTATR